MPVLVVRVGDEERALPAARVREVATLGAVTPMPTAPPSLYGLMQLRGQVLPLLRLGRGGLMREPPEPLAAPRAADPVVVVELGPLRAGLIVDEVVGVRAEAEGAPLDVGALLDGVRAEVLACARGE